MCWMVLHQPVELAALTRHVDLPPDAPGLEPESPTTTMQRSIAFFMPCLCSSQRWIQMWRGEITLGAALSVTTIAKPHFKCP
jgi:hypothetical protein